jgi:hypothetical protein
MSSNKRVPDSFLKEEIETYDSQRKYLTEKAEGKFVLIHKKEVIGIFDAEKFAVSEGYRQFGEQPFLVKQISKVEIPLNFTSYALGV